MDEILSLTIKRKCELYKICNMMYSMLFTRFVAEEHTNLTSEDC